MAGEKRILLDYPELYTDENIEYFSNLNREIENLSELYVLEENLKPVRELILKLTDLHLGILNQIAKDLKQKRVYQDVNAWWDLDIDTLTANETLFLISYPFWERWGGSWEVRFACSGDLGKYLSVYKEKIRKEKSER